MTTATTSAAASHSLTGTVGALLLSSACIAMLDVIADGIVVKRTREISAQNKEKGNSENVGSLQSLCWGSAVVGGLLFSYFSGSLLEIMSVSNVFSIAAALPLLVAIIASRMDDQPVCKERLIAVKT